jgi:hypothetical protein
LDIGDHEAVAEPDLAAAEEFRDDRLDIGDHEAVAEPDLAAATAGGASEEA